MSRASKGDSSGASPNHSPQVPALRRPTLAEFCNILDLAIAHTEADDSVGLVRCRIVLEVKIFSVMRPHRVTRTAVTCFCPLLRGRIEEHQLFGYRGHAGNVSAIGRPMGRIVPRRAGQGRDMPGFQVEDIDPTIRFQSGTEDERLSVWRPIRIQSGSSRWVAGARPSRPRSRSHKYSRSPAGTIALNAICVPSGDQRGIKTFMGGEVSWSGSLPSTRLRHSVPSG